MKYANKRRRESYASSSLEAVDDVSACVDVDRRKVD
jgi:hypothetical protein